MNIKWISVNDELPKIGENVLTCDTAFPDDGFEWECIIHIEDGIGAERDIEWQKSYSVSHWARLSVRDLSKNPN